MLSEDEIIRILDVLYHACMSSGGDGDALWYSRFVEVKDVLPVLEAYNAKLKYPMGIEVKHGVIHWGQDQEWILITNDETVFTEIPSWVEFQLRY